MRKSQHILGLSIENFKRIGVFNVDLTDKSLVVVSGKNGQGKSSVIDAVHSALAGKNYFRKHIENPIKKGEEEAHVIISTDHFEIHRYWKKNGKDYIKIKDKEGIPQGSQETLLSRFYNEYSRDPHRMAEMDSKEQTAFLFKLLGMTEKLVEFNDRRAKVYEERTAVNRDRNREESILDSMDKYEEVPDVPSHREVLDELQEANEFNDSLERAKSSYDQLEFQVNEIRKKISDLEVIMSEKTDKMKELDEFMNGKEPVDLEPLKKKLEDVDQKKEEARKAEEYLRTKARVNNLITESDDLTAHIEKIDKEKESFIKSVDLPVEGMKIEDDSITYNGTAVKDLSTSEAIIFWSNVFMSTNPELKFLTLDNAESLDSENRKAIEKFAKDNDLLYLVSVVDESGEVGIVLEEGEIKVNNYEKSRTK